MNRVPYINLLSILMLLIQAQNFTFKNSLKI